MFSSPRNPHIEVDWHRPVMHIANDEMVMDASLLEPCEGQGVKVPKGIGHINSPYRLPWRSILRQPIQARSLPKEGCSMERCGAQAGLAVCAPHCDRMMRIAQWNAVATVCIIAKSFGYNRRCGLRRSEPSTM